MFYHLHKLLLTNAQVSKLCKAFANGSSAHRKTSKTQLHKIEKSGGLPLIENVFKPLVKNVLIQSGLTAVASAIYPAIHKKMFGSGAHLRMLDPHSLDLGKQTTLIISNEEMNNIMKIIKSLEESGLLIKGVSKTIKNEAKHKKEDFLE